VTQKLTIHEWAALEFATPPAERTLRQWVKEGQIVPPPIKIGRAYYVRADAKHIAEATVIARQRLRTT
jgi:predicted site-specific integrase-resolvase